MIAQLLGSQIGEITCVCVRYFGGIKLGTGGLVKAYGNGVQQALKLLQTKTKIPQKFSILAVITHRLVWLNNLFHKVKGK